MKARWIPKATHAVRASYNMKMSTVIEERSRTTRDMGMVCSCTKEVGKRKANSTMGSRIVAAQIIEGKWTKLS